MVRRTTRVERAASNTDSASHISSRTIPLPKGKDEGYQPVVNSISAPPIIGARSHYSYGPCNATTPALISDNDLGSSPPSLPSTITPLLLQPTLQDFISSPEKNADGRYSPAAKGKGKAWTEDEFFLDQHPTDLGPLDYEDMLYPFDFPSTAEWVEHTQPILQDYANRQIPLPLGRRVDVSLNEHSQFMHGALQLLANRDHPQNSPIDASRQFGPQLIENFTDVHRWATEYFRTRFGMPTVGSDIPVLLTIITNNFYEAHTNLIDSIALVALDNMRGRGADSLDIEDFAFGYDFEMSQELPFAVESSYLIHDTLKQHQRRPPLELPVNLPVTTRCGRQSKPTMQAQAADLAIREKQATARQREKEKAKKDRDLTAQRKVVPQVTKKNATTPAASDVMCAPSTSTYHARNNGSLSHGPLRGIRGNLRKVEANAGVFTGAKCPTCGTVMPPHMPVTPTNTHSASQYTANLKISNDLNSVSNRAITGSTDSSNLRLASVAPQHPPLAVPSPIGFPPSASARDTAGHANTTATLLETTTGTQDAAQAQVPARGGRLYLRARGARGNRSNGRGRGQGGGASAPLTIVAPARPRPVAPVSPAVPPASVSTAVIAPTKAGRRDPSGKSARGSSTASTHTANPVPTIAASSKKHVPPKGVRPGSVNTTGGADYKVAIAAFARAYYSRCDTNQIAAEGSNANAGVDNTTNSHVYASVPSGTSNLGTKGPTSARACYPPSTTTAAASATASPAAGSSRDRAIDFTDPEFWTKHARSTCDSSGFVAQVPNSSTRPAVAARSNRVHTAVTSSSQVDTRKTKKRKLDDSE